MQPITERLRNGFLLFDGGTGTNLQKLGMRPGESSEDFAARSPESMKKLHKDYVDAGADIIKTNTFGANPLKAPDYAEKIRRGVRLAREAAENQAYVFGDIGPTGKMLFPLGELGFEDAVSAFASMCRVFDECGVDGILIETFGDLYEAKAALLAVKENTRLPVFITFTFDENGRTVTGGTPEAAAILAESLSADAVGVNCSNGPDKLLPLIRRMAGVTRLPLICNPNAGVPRYENGETLFTVPPEAFVPVMKEMALFGVTFLGGCCGTTPAHIAAVKAALTDVPFGVRSVTPPVCVTSGSKTIVFGEKPVLIGERLNPTGKKALKDALRRRDMDYILRVAATEEEEGADILDINAGLPEIDEVACLSQILTAVQSQTVLPLSIDSGNKDAVEKALRLCNGRPLLNSVSGKEESLGSILPLMKKYGCVAVALTLDDDGIPETAEGRIAVTEKIISRAENLGIPKENFLFDALTLSVATDEKAASVTLKTVEELTRRGLKTVLGVSNISFGLPERDTVNAVFFSEALEKGLTAAIMNPASLPMQKTYRVYNLLHGIDKNAADYIAFASALPTDSEPNANPLPVKNTADFFSPLSNAILRGLSGDAADIASSLVHKLADKTAAFSLIGSDVIPALTEVGRRYEKGILFLPQLLLSAESAKAALAVLKSGLPQTDASRGRILLATVKGDIHDIGKNIVKSVVESYGFSVLDLGRDVPPQEILEAAKREHITFVGLSALMTTTIPAMKETVELFKKDGYPAVIAVGGAVLTESVAKDIGADIYCPDAPATAKAAVDHFKSKIQQY